MTEEEFDAAVMAGPIVDNASTRLYAIGELEAERIECFHCNGDGWFTETVEGPGDTDVEIDYVCGACSGSGEEQ